MRLHRWFLALLALAVVVPVRTSDFEKYLLDDTDAVLTINVKQLVGSTAYTKNLQKKIEDQLKALPAQMVLKDSGFDPLKDIERVTLVTGRSVHRTVEKNGDVRTQ